MLFDKVKIELDFEDKNIKDHKPIKKVETKIEVEDKSDLFKYATDRGYLENNNIYVKQLFRNTFIVIDYLEESWEGYRINYDNKNNVTNSKTIIRDNNLVNVINRTENYINNYLSFIKKAS